MNTINSIALFDKKLNSMKNISTVAKSEILKLAMTIFRNVVDVENVKVESQINEYTSEIFQVVKNNSQDEETCKQYIEFVLRSIAGLGKN